MDMDLEALAVLMTRVYLASLILCQDDFEEEDVMFWSSLHESTYGLDLAREIEAYRRAKLRLRQSRAGNPQNVVAVLLYNISHTSPRTLRRKNLWKTRLNKGFSLAKITRLDQALSLIQQLQGSYLSERDIGALVGCVVNLDRVARIIIEEYENLRTGGEHGA